MTDFLIRAALESRLKTLTPAIPIVWQVKTPAKTFNPKDPYIKAFLMPASNRTLGLSEKTTVHKGIFQVSLCYPTGFGMRDVEAMAAAVQQHFPAGLVLEAEGVKVRIRGKPDIAADLGVESPLVVPVSIRYESFN
jgi:hypothetical protein